MPTLTPARHGASKPIIATVTQGGALARGCGRGHRNTPPRERGKTAGPAWNRAVTPASIDEVVRDC